MPAKEIKQDPPDIIKDDVVFSTAEIEKTEFVHIEASVSKGPPLQFPQLKIKNVRQGTMENRKIS